LKKIRFGIIGCSKIADRSLLPAIINSDFAELEIIGSRDIEKAEKFANKFKCKNFGTYDDVIDGKNVDAIYISVPTGLHQKWAEKAAKSGKHVLCEKTAVTSYSHAKEVISTVKENKTRIMEGFMFKFHPQHVKLREIIVKENFGKSFIFSGMYGFPPISKSDIRYNAGLGGGALNETGCYPIYASRMIFDEEPISVSFNLFNDLKNNVDIKGHGSIEFSKGRKAFIGFSFENQYQANYKIWGEKGIAELKRAYAVPPDFSSTIELTISDKKSQIKIEPTDHFKNMIDIFCQEIQKNGKDSINFEEDLLNQAKLLEAIRESSRKNTIINLSDIH
jgi:dTDP-3,4-didehydro-2,6-dideoxy-alpha-D-glucose 3-reductase